MLIFLIAFIAGIISGLAIGGNTLLVPAMVVLLGIEQHLAQGSALAAFLPTAAVAVITHYRRGNIVIPVVVKLATGSVIGAVIGSLLAVNIPSNMLRKIFGIFLIAMGIYELICKGSQKEQQLAKDKPNQ
jgi:uncharacterized protein